MLLFVATCISLYIYILAYLHISAHLHIFLSVHLYIYISINLNIYIPVYLPMYICTCINVSMYLHIHTSIDLFIVESLSFSLSVFPLLWALCFYPTLFRTGPGVGRHLVSVALPSSGPPRRRGGGAVDGRFFYMNRYADDVCVCIYVCTYAYIRR